MTTIGAAVWRTVTLRPVACGLVALTAVLADAGGSVSVAAADEEAGGTNQISSNVEGWSGAWSLDARQTETLVVQETTQKAVRRTGTRPYRVLRATGHPCHRYVALLPDGRSSITRHHPAVGPLDRMVVEDAYGETYRWHLVEPAAQGRPKVTALEGTECRLPAAPQPPGATRTTATFGERVSDLFTLPDPVLELTPATDGLTGRETRLSAGGIPSEPLPFPPTTLKGRQVAFEARPVSFEWDTGDSGTAAPQSRYVTQGPGSPEQPAVTHVYETKSSVGRPDEGVYTIRLTVRWERRFRVVGTVDPCNEWCLLDPGETSTVTPYRVAEVRSVLVDQIGGQG